jgi:hypothetical protein
MTDKSGWRHNTTADSVSKRWESYKRIPFGSERLCLSGRSMCSTTQHPPGHLLMIQGGGEASVHPGQVQTGGRTDATNTTQ